MNAKERKQPIDDDEWTDDNDVRGTTILTILDDARRPIIGFWLLGSIDPMMSLFCVGPFMIWCVVRTLNRQHDPRHVVRSSPGFLNSCHP
jgi:hypothetical protein